MARLLSSAGSMDGCSARKIVLNSKKCILALLTKNIIKNIFLTSDLCSINIKLSDVDINSALRSLESEALNLEVQAERAHRRSVIEEKEAVENLIKMLSIYGRPVVFSLELVFCSELKAKETVRYLSIYGCSPKITCINNINKEKTKYKFIKFFQFIRNPIAVPQILVASSLKYLIDYYGSLSLAEQQTVAIPIGYTLRTSHFLYLPLYRDILDAYHTIVVGPTGMGKTTLLAYIIKVIILNNILKCVYIVDPKGDLSGMLEPDGSRSTASRPIFIARSVEEMRLLVRFSKNCGPPGILVIDEAWSIDSSFLVAMYKAARSRGIAVVAATQDPWDIDSRVWSNASNIIVFGSSNSDYARRIEKLLGLNNVIDTLKLLVDSGDFAIKYRWSSTLIEARFPLELAAKLLETSLWSSW